MKFKPLILLLLLYSTFTTFSQNKLIDSLRKTSLKQTKSEQILTFIELSKKFKGISLDSSNYYSKKAFRVSELIDDKRLKIIAWLELGNFNRENSQFDRALEYFDKTFKLSREINDSTLIANSYTGTGIVNSRLGNFNLAIMNFYKALPIYENLNDTTNISKSYLNLAIDLKKIKEFNKSINYNLRALTIFKKNKDYLNIAAVNNNLSGLYNQNEEYKKAIESAEKARKYFVDNNYIRYSAYPLTNIAISYDSLKKNKKAEKAYLQAIELHTIHREPYELAFLNNAYANLKLKQKNYKEAILSGKKSLKFAKEVKAIEFLVSSSKTLAKTYERLNNSKESNKYLKKYILYKDSIINKEKLKVIKDSETKYETEKKEKEIAQQKEQLLSQQIEIKSKSIYAITLTSVLLIVGIIFFAIYKRNQLKRKQLQKEIDLKDALATIKTQNRLQEQRLRISRDLHDNVGSQLTFIISSIDNLKFISKNANENLKEKLSNISSFTGDTIHQLRDTIWAMNKSEISIEDLHLRVLSFIEKAKEAVPEINFNIQYNIDHKTSFSSLIGMNLFRATQEALNNAIKHASANKIKVLLIKSNNLFTISIIDNGSGFDLNTTDLGNGLFNIEKRMSEINGTTIIDSKPNMGTKINLKIPLKRKSK